MQIGKVSTRIVSIPLKWGFSTPGGFQAKSVSYVLVQACSLEGHRGIGYALALNGSRINVIKAMIDELTPLVVGEDPFCTEKIWQKLRRYTTFLGHEGLVVDAISAIDIAIWDLLGKITGQPLCKLLGGDKPGVPIYASDALWPDVPVDQVCRQAQDFVAKGFKSIKLHIGHDPGLKKDVERVKAVREAIGEGINLMVDAVQSWKPWQAIRIGRMLEEHNIYWMEDPVSATDLEGSAQVSGALDMAIAAGEWVYSPRGLMRLIQSKAVDIVLVDIQRAGGITGYRKIATIAEAFEAPIAPHVFPEIGCHLVSAFRNSLIVEYMTWAFPLFKEPPQVKDGLMLVPQKPGLGMELDEKAVERYAVS
ncbi:MAG: mandelate racemase/muconate lactonizing enzyme family protein [Chloroflexi bacterium]|nr:mandelate racemase/muconate lactonizing enzyme family protein [Chloroflexota bacterium]